MSIYRIHFLPYLPHYRNVYNRHTTELKGYLGKWYKYLEIIMPHIGTSKVSWHVLVSQGQFK